ncbi:MAG TPA: glycosyltransferase [Candidatus Methylomirabilis sp.]
MARAHVLILDTGHEWGGGTNSLLELVARLPKDRYRLRAGFSSDYRRGDGETIGEALAAHGVDFHHLSLPASRREKLAREMGRALRLGRARRDFLFRHDLAWRVRPAVARLAALLKAERVDLVYCNNQPSTNLEGILAAGQVGTPCVAHLRKETALRPFEVGAANAHVTRFICVSRALRDRYTAQGIDAGKAVVVYNGLDAGRPVPAGDEKAYGDWGIAPAQPVVGAVGSLLKLKGYDLLLEAFAMLRRDGWADARLVVLGEGPERRALAAAARRLGVAEAVRFAGFVPDPLPVMARFDVLAVPSSSEGCPRSVLEAMFLGCPVAAFAVGGVPELVADGETGVLVKDRNPRRLADALLLLLGDGARRRAMGAVARARVAERFSVDRYVAEVDEVLTEALAPAR